MKKIIFVIMCLCLWINNVIAWYWAASSKIDWEFIPLIISVLIVWWIFYLIIRVTPEFWDSDWSDKEYMFKYLLFQLIFTSIIFYIFKTIYFWDYDNVMEEWYVFPLFFTAFAIYITFKSKEIHNLQKFIWKVFVAVLMYYIIFSILFLSFIHKKDAIPYVDLNNSKSFTSSTSTISSVQNEAIITNQNKITSCTFNWKIIIKPNNSYCITDDNNNAWKCGTWYYEKDSQCWCSSWEYSCYNNKELDVMEKKRIELENEINKWVNENSNESINRYNNLVSESNQLSKSMNKLMNDTCICKKE